MDRASDYGSEGWGFESLRDHKQIRGLQKCRPLFVWHLAHCCIKVAQWQVLKENRLFYIGVLNAFHPIRFRLFLFHIKVAC